METPELTFASLYEMTKKGMVTHMIRHHYCCLVKGGMIRIIIVCNCI
jgi:hypothetical protein